MTASLPNVWFNESAQPSLGPASPVADTEFPSVSVATGSCGGGESRPALSSTLAPQASAVADVVVRPAGVAPGPHDLASDTQYIVEYFSDYTRRRCMDKISPPLPKVERNIDGIALNAVRKALNIHPRDLDEDPPPLFLRSPRPAFLRALLELGGAR